MQTDGWTDGLAQHSLYHPVGCVFYLLSSFFIFDSLRTTKTTRTLSRLSVPWWDTREQATDDEKVISPAAVAVSNSDRCLAVVEPNRLTRRRKRKREDQSARPEVDCFSSDAFFPSAFSLSLILPKEFRDKQTKSTTQTNEK
jgi:hypothetical protein